MRGPFTSCFIGIPLPEEFQQEFEQLLDKLATMNPYMKLVQKKTPHITLYYLDEQSQNNLQEIAHTTEGVVSRLRGCELTIGGLGVFNADFPRVVYLSADYPPALQEVNSLLREQLNSYYAADNNLPFLPHMTVASIPDDKARSIYKQNENGINELLNNIQWAFLVKEVVIYGVDSRKEPEGQEKLLSITMNDE